jgi:prepilin-type N-terminal cleavage/methylation domain-containing protein
MKDKTKKKGFTLIELLVVVTILAVLAVTVFVALNPSKRIKDSKDARRATDIDTILTAVHEKIVDDKGAIPSWLTTTEKQIGTAVTGCIIATGTCAVAATADCVNPVAPANGLDKYLKSNPIDPDGTAALTGYTIVLDANNIVTVKACKVENSASLTISR